MLKKVFFTDEETIRSNRDRVLQEDAENAEHESNAEVLRGIEKKRILLLRIRKIYLNIMGCIMRKKGLKDLTLRRQR